MSASQGCTDDKAVIEIFKEALKQRVGQDVYQAWFSAGVSFRIGDAGDSDQPSGMTAGHVIAEIRGQFALDRLARNYSRELRGAAMQAFGRAMEVQLVLAKPPQQVALPIDDLNQADAQLAARSDQSQRHRKRTRETRLSETQSRGTQSRGTQSRGTQARDEQSHGSQARAKQPSGGQGIASLVQRSSSRKTARRSRRRKPKSEGTSLTQPTFPGMPETEKLPAEPAKKHASKTNRTVSGDSPQNASVLENASSQGSESQSRDSQGTAQQRMTMETFVAGKCNQLARTAAQLVCENPQAGSPLFISGPPGVGKTHLLFAIANLLRRRHRMRRVMHLSAEKFTNDFVRCVSDGTLTTLRSMYRDVDAFIVDDVQFLSAKKATLREMLYTVESLMDRGKTLIFAATHSPSEIAGLTQELSGRLSAGLVCTMQALDSETREILLRQSIDEKCLFPWPEETIGEISQTLPGDGRRISGFVNLVSVLQRMNDRMPTTAELYEFGGDLLRSDKPFVTMSKIQRAVAQTFQMDEEMLQSKSQARTATEPRMLAMYLSRELTPAAFAEIGRHFGGRSHSAAILARRRVETWLASGKSIGRGSAALSARDALDRIESLLRSG
jgi:chromosomal replication initiator protein